MERLSRKDLVGLLAKAIGENSGVAVIDEACSRLGYSTAELPLNEALEVLEVIAQRDDLTGIAARFAKARARSLVIQRR